MLTTGDQPQTHAARDLTLAWLLVLTCMIIIFYLSAQSALGGQKWPPIFQALRKSSHIVEYGALGIFIGRALVLTWTRGGQAVARSMLRRAWWLGVVVSTAYALTDEFHQSFVPGRGAHLEDVLIDALSAIAALGIWFLWRTNRRRQADRWAVAGD